LLRILQEFQPDFEEEAKAWAVELRKEEVIRPSFEIVVV
jgi:hypothetical protein